MVATTIKIDAGLRDRLNAEARRRHVPVGSFVEELLDAWQRDQRFEQLRDEMASTSRDDWASYQEESQDWELLAGSGTPHEDRNDAS